MNYSIILVFLLDPGKFSHLWPHNHALTSLSWLLLGFNWLFWDRFLCFTGHNVQNILFSDSASFSRATYLLRIQSMLHSHAPSSRCQLIIQIHLLFFMFDCGLSHGFLWLSWLSLLLLGFSRLRGSFRIPFNLYFDQSSAHSADLIVLIVDLFYYTVVSRRNLSYQFIREHFADILVLLNKGGYYRNNKILLWSSGPPSRTTPWSWLLWFPHPSPASLSSQ